MKNKKRFAIIIVVLFASVLLLISCGRSERTDDRSDSLDSLVNDSVPLSGENEYQQDIVPQGLPKQIDSLSKDSVEKN